MFPVCQNSSWLTGPFQSPVLGQGSYRVGPPFGGPYSQEGRKVPPRLTQGPRKVETIVLTPQDGVQVFQGSHGCSLKQE